MVGLIGAIYACLFRLLLNRFSGMNVFERSEFGSLKDLGSRVLGTDLLGAPFNGVNFFALTACVSARDICEFLPFVLLPGNGLFNHACLAIFSIYWLKISPASSGLSRSFPARYS